MINDHSPKKLRGMLRISLNTFKCSPERRGGVLPYRTYKAILYTCIYILFHWNYLMRKYQMFFTPALLGKGAQVAQAFMVESWREKNHLVLSLLRISSLHRIYPLWFSCDVYSVCSHPYCPSHLSWSKLHHMSHILHYILHRHQGKAHILMNNLKIKTFQ